MASLLLLLVIVQSIFSSGVRGWDWRDWWTPEGWDAWWDDYEEFGLINDVSDYVVPMTFLEVRFGDTLVHPGQYISPLKSFSPPDIAWYCDKTKYYSLIMLSVDAPATNFRNEFVSWRVEGISDCDLKTGKTLSHYFPPNPTAGTGTYRYLILMFEFDTYAHSLVGDLLKATAGNVDISMDGYIKKYGIPFSGNFWRAKNDILGENLVPVDRTLPLEGVTGVVHKVEGGAANII